MDFLIFSYLFLYFHFFFAIFSYIFKPFSPINVSNPTEMHVDRFWRSKIGNLGSLIAIPVCIQSYPAFGDYTHITRWTIKNNQDIRKHKWNYRQANPKGHVKSGKRFQALPKSALVRVRGDFFTKLHLDLMGLGGAGSLWKKTCNVETITPTSLRTTL